MIARVRLATIAATITLSAGLPVPAIAQSPQSSAQPDSLARADSAAVDSTRAVPARSRVRPRPDFAMPSPAVDVVFHDQYLRFHPVSFDQWLEGRAGGVLVRQGPIGKDAFWSRWGMGRGRARVYLDGIDFTDPQNGLAPFAHMPVSGMETVHFDVYDGTTVATDVPIEGILDLRENRPPEDRPRVFIEASNGDRSLRQRRVRFSSVEGLLGVDIGYDELLNDGYWFDASEGIPYVQGFGQTQTRHVSARLRGMFDTGERWEIGFRRFTADAQSDLTSAAAEQRRSGHLATLRASVGRMDLAVYERSFEVTDTPGTVGAPPDSNTASSTRAAFVTLHAVRFRGASLRIRGGIEDTAAEQRVGSGVSNDGTRRITASAEGGARLGENTTMQLSGTYAADLSRQSAWGFDARLRRAMGRQAVVLEVRRGFRLPSLGELFLPVHTSGAFTLAGNHNVGDEHSLEAGVLMENHWGALTNDLRLSAIRVTDPIAYRPDAAYAADWRVAQNGEAADLVAIDENARINTALGPIRMTFGAGVTLTGGDRDGFMVGASRLRAVASARIGAELFQETSALYVNVDFRHEDDRHDYDGMDMAAFDVLDVVVSGRILDAHLYVGMINALDERYTTEGNYLMTPRTLVYGVHWSLFE